MDGREFFSAGDAKFSIDGGEVIVDGACRKGQEPGYVAAGESLGRQRRDLGFAGAEWGAKSSNKRSGGAGTEGRKA